MRDLRAGDIVYGPTREEIYKIIEPLGNGSFGYVYKIHDEQGNQFALKTISTAGLNETALRALANEGRLAMQIQHPNVLRVFYFHNSKQYPELPPYMILEYADGGTLQDVLNQQRATGKHFSTEELKVIFMQLAKAMKAVNATLVHRDIKPDNILRVGTQLKIADFGLSKVVSAATRTQTFKGINHILYCAPEAWKLEGNLPSMDMYSMGITFYEIATLQSPYDVSDRGNQIEAWMNAHFFQLPLDPQTFNAGLDSRLVQIILKMIEKDPRDRYATWDDVIQRLEGGDTSTLMGRDVGLLIQLAIAGHQKANQAQLEAEQETAKRNEFINFVKFSVEKIVEAAREIVDTFNLQSEFVALKLHDTSDPFSFGFMIFAEGSGLNLAQVEIHIEHSYEGYDFHGQKVRAWGYAKSPSGRGFNLILVLSGPDDLYGTWITLEATHNPRLVNRKLDKRPTPFPFEILELRKVIESAETAQRFQVKQGDFQAEALYPLIQELLSPNP